MQYPLGYHGFLRTCLIMPVAIEIQLLLHASFWFFLLTHLTSSLALFLNPSTISSSKELPHSSSRDVT